MIEGFADISRPEIIIISRVEYDLKFYYMIKYNLLSAVVVLVLMSLGSTSHAQIRTYSNEFLTLGVGARGLAMGTVQSAFVDDVTAAYWNPAGLNDVENFQVGLQHAEWFAGIGKYDYLGFAKPIDNGNKAIGLSIIRFGVDDIPNTLNVIDPDGNVNYDNISTFSAADYAALLTYAFKFKGFKVGANAKIIHRRVGSFANSWGFGLDVGAQYQLNNRVNLGLTIKDLTTTFNAWSFDFTEEEKAVLELTDNVIPVSSVELTGQRVILGAAYRLPIGQNLQLLAAMDLDITFDERNTFIHTGAMSLDPHIGLELGFKEFLFLRTGINNIQRFTDDADPTKEVLSIQPSLGLGIKVNRITIDYAFTGLNRVSQGVYSNVFSLKFDLGSDSLLN